MKQFLREYFTFTRRERNGIFILLCIILLLILYLAFSDLFLPETKTDFSGFQKEVAEFEAALKQSEDSLAAAPQTFPEKRFPIEHKASAHPDKKRQDWFKPTGKKPLRKPDLLVIELNSSDTSELQKLKGIGPVFARRIVKFRDALGGFIRKEQLLEVYGMDTSRYSLISEHLLTDTSLVKKLNINSASPEELSRHPYITRKLASRIYWYRMNHGRYASVQDALKVNLAEEGIIARLIPYLAI